MFASLCLSVPCGPQDPQVPHQCSVTPFTVRVCASPLPGGVFFGSFWADPDDPVDGSWFPRPPRPPLPPRPPRPPRPRPRPPHPPRPPRDVREAA